MKLKSFASGYLVENNKVLLVHHRKFDKWTPPGGHLEENELPNEAVVREIKEELDLDVEIVPAYPSAFAGDSNATIIPMPFHMDVETEGFDVPHLGTFFYVKRVNPEQAMKHQADELHNFGWFGLEDLENLKTFEQVRALAKFAINNYPKN